MEVTRIDRFLWAVRVYKTRTAATEACRGGHVEVNRQGAKPATLVRVGDHITVTTPDGARRLEVATVIDKRVSATAAAGCVIDTSPPRPPRSEVAPVFAREPGTARPTKRDRRKLDELRRN